MGHNGFHWGQIRQNIMMAFYEYVRSPHNQYRDLIHIWNVAHLLNENTLITPDYSVTDVTGLKRNRQLYIPIPPLIAVEIANRFTTATILNAKNELYYQSGVKQIWNVFPETKTIHVWEHGAALRYTTDDRIICETVLPHLELPVEDIFRI